MAGSNRVHLWELACKLKRRIRDDWNLNTLEQEIRKCSAILDEMESSKRPLNIVDTTR
jgi:hypothetical protein